MDHETKAFHVFLNHMGTDTKRSLASLIHRDLKRFGLEVFLDSVDLRTGNYFPLVIKRVIGNANIHIAIFSKGYAESYRCLMELCWILELPQNKNFIPVFCDVEPKHLRDTNRGPYAAAFQKHEGGGKVDMEIVKKWRETLKKAADFVGPRFRTDESNYGDLLEEIKDSVLKNVMVPLEVAAHPVGLDEAEKDLENKIQNQRATKIVGIWGIAGIGKSTLAKLFFNLRHSDFNRSCYLSNVRESNLLSLQRQLLRVLMGNDMDITKADIGKPILREGLRGLKILLVLDDVDDMWKIKSLLDMDAVEPGSLILITCCDKYILSGTANTFLYEVKPLERKHAQELFCFHAFGKSEPSEEYKDLVWDFLDICEGLPLFLEDLGECLACKLDIMYWKEQLKMSSQGMPLRGADRVIKRQRLCYEAMYEYDKGLCLNNVCFFDGEETELAVRVLEKPSRQYIVRDGLERLVQKCFVKFDKDVESHHEIESREQDKNPQENRYLSKYMDTYINAESYLSAVLPHGSSRIIIRNQVKELARHIVRQHLSSNDKSRQPLRLTCSDDIEILLESKVPSDFCKIQGIRIPRGQTLPQLTNSIQGVVKFLVVEQPINDLMSFFSSGVKADLVWLRLRNSFFIFIPDTISPRSLQVLDVQGPIDYLEELFNSLQKFSKNRRMHGIPTRLCELIIDHDSEASSSATSSRPPVDPQHSMESSLRNISNSHNRAIPSFDRFLHLIGIKSTCLYKIVLKNIPFLHSLPIDFSNLRNLEHLDLSGSINLTKLPTSFSRLPQLQYLALRDCSRLAFPTDMLGDISTLEYIDFKGCRGLEHLPQGIASQKGLRYLNLLDTSLRDLPLNLKLLDKLDKLRIGSRHITKLPDSVASLEGLKEFILVGCLNLDHITPIEKLKHLEILRIYESVVERILPQGIVQLKNIKVLTIDSSPIAEFSFQTPASSVNQDAMEVLTYFTLTRTSICNICIPTVVCPRLEVVDLSYSLQLQQVQGFPSSLVRLNLEGCSKLKALTNLANLINLRFLNINGCVELETLNVKGLTSLEEISAEKCWKLQTIEAFDQLKRLNFLGVSTYLDGRLFSNALDFDEKVMQFIEHYFHQVTVHTVPATTTVRSPVRLSNVLSHSAIFMCFITRRESRNGFSVCFEPSNNRARYEEYKTIRGDGYSSGRMLHMYMWTEDSKLFKDESLYTKVAAFGSCNGNELDVGDSEKGWIVMLANKTEVLHVCKSFIFEGIFNEKSRRECRASNLKFSLTRNRQRNKSNFSPYLRNSK